MTQSISPARYRQVPLEVVRQLQPYQLGACFHTYSSGKQRSTPKFVALCLVLVLFAPLSLFAMSHFAGSPQKIPVIGIFLPIFAVCAAVYITILLLRGTFFVGAYEKGLVHVKKGLVTLVPWEQVASCERAMVMRLLDLEGNILRLKIRTTTGARFVVTAPFRALNPLAESIEAQIETHVSNTGQAGNQAESRP